MASTSIRNLIQIILMSTGAICIAVLVTPPIFNLFASAHPPELWINLRSWLRPPFLYLVVNGIILSIAAASRLHHHHNKESGVDTEPYSYSDEKIVYALPAPEAEVSEFSDSSYDADLDSNGGAMEVVMCDETTPFGAEEDKEVIVEDGVAVKYVAENDDFAPDDVIDTKASPLERQATPETVTSFFESQIKEPSPTTRADPEDVKPLHEGNESLDDTWRRITEGSRRLKTSDTWKDRSRKMASSEPSTPKTVRKWSNRSPSTRRIRREPSLSQDELNQRVEAFIRKFNQDMRLERQNSVKYMINPAA